MIIYVLLAMVAALILLYLPGFKNIKVIYLKKLALPLLCILFLLCLIIFSKTAVNSALRGLNLWYNVVFPSLFPFFVSSELLNKSGFVKAFGVLLEPVMRPLFNVPGCGSFAFAMGVTSGYPVGARITSSLKEEKLITKAEAERLLAFTNNSGPLFVIGAVGVGMFNSSKIGVFLLTCHILACITVGIILKFSGKESRSKIPKNERGLLKRFKNELGSVRPTDNIGGLFGDAIKNSISLILTIGGFIIFFSVVINLLLETRFIYLLSDTIGLVLSPMGIDKGIIISVISGLFEITTGTSLTSKIEGISIIHKLTAASIIIGWGGISVHTQVISIVNNTGISIKSYICGKMLQSIISAAYTYAALKLSMHLSINILSDASPAFSHLPHIQPGWTEYFMDSIKFTAGSISILLISGLVVSILNVKIKRGRI